MPKKKVEIIGSLALDGGYKKGRKYSLFSYRAPNLGSRRCRRTGERGSRESRRTVKPGLLTGQEVPGKFAQWET